MPPFPPNLSGSRVPSRHSDDPSVFYRPQPIRHIKDIIYDLIPVTLYLSRFIDTKPFQRLRNIKQLGTTFYVWPGASHSRFEHCLGVAYLARYVASHLQTSQPELGITDRDVACVEIAGLCHDLGHGPWSHVWDGIFMKGSPLANNWCHEDGSEMMFDYIIEQYGIPMAQDDVSFVKALIAGEKGKCSPDEKEFLFDIVANKRNGIDVDKFDYIQRDSHMLGESMSISLTRILKSARVNDNQICYNIKDADSIWNICTARFSLHKRFYNHKAAKAIEYMIVDALRSADPHLGISSRVLDPEKFLHLTDVIMNRIEETTEPELETARAIFTRIRERDLYRCVDYKVVEYKLRDAFDTYITPERIVQASRTLPRDAYSSAVLRTAAEAGGIELEQMDGDPCEGEGEGGAGEVLQPEDIVVDFATMHHGMKDKYPLDSVKFYSKNNPDASLHISPGVHSTLLPATFAEVMLRIYTKKSKFYGRVQAGFRALLREMDQSLAPDGTPLGAAPVGPVTPPTSIHGDEEDDSHNHHDHHLSDDVMTKCGVSDIAPLTPTDSDRLPLPSHSQTSETTTKSHPLAAQKNRSFGRAVSTSFVPNPFTSVHRDFAPPNPAAGVGRAGSRVGSAASSRGLADVATGGKGEDEEGDEEDWSEGMGAAPVALALGTSGGAGRKGEKVDERGTLGLKRSREGDGEGCGAAEKKRKA